MVKAGAMNFSPKPWSKGAHVTDGGAGKAA